MSHAPEQVLSCEARAGDAVMRTAEWKRLVRPLLPVEERWEFRGSLCYRAPVGRFMFGVLAEGSAFDTGVYIWRVSMPLLVPRGTRWRRLVLLRACRRRVP